MAKLTVQDLKKIKERVEKEKALSKANYTVEIIVHMGTCGIAAGADEVYDALKERIETLERGDIKVVISACMGMCSSEPNVTVETEGAEPIVYKDMDSNKMRQVFKRHVLLGEVQTAFALARI